MLSAQRRELAAEDVAESAADVGVDLVEDHRVPTWTWPVSTDFSASIVRDSSPPLATLRNGAGRFAADWRPAGSPGFRGRRRDVAGQRIVAERPRRKLGVELRLGHAEFGEFLLHPGDERLGDLRPLLAELRPELGDVGERLPDIRLQRVATFLLADELRLGGVERLAIFDQFVDGLAVLRFKSAQKLNAGLDLVLPFGVGFGGLRPAAKIAGDVLDLVAGLLKAFRDRGQVGVEAVLASASRSSLPSMSERESSSS